MNQNQKQNANSVKGALRISAELPLIYGIVGGKPRRRSRNHLSNPTVSRASLRQDRKKTTVPSPWQAITSDTNASIQMSGKPTLKK